MTTTIGRAKISLASVNEAARGDALGFMADCDKSYEKRVGDIVRRIAADTGKAKIILLSGPSASGKTTTSFKLKQGLGLLGINAVTISMDDFFKPRELTPLLPDGSRDYESIESIDLSRLKLVLSQLIAEGRTELPSFNFKLGRCDEMTTPIELRDGSVAVMEGLHALDTAVTAGLPVEHMLRLYVSVSSDFVDDAGETVLTAREARLTRRIIRDYHFRGSSPENTLDMWGQVCHGEDKYIRPFKKYADITVNSVFQCEPCLLASSAVKLFGGVREGSRHYETARHMAAALGRFEQMPLEIVPGSCVLREFIGGSDYYNKSSAHRTV